MAVVELDRMPGIVPAVVTRDGVEAVREEIDEFALSFVSPLAAEHGERLDSIERHAKRSIRLPEGAGSCEGASARAPSWRDPI